MTAASAFAAALDQAQRTVSPISQLAGDAPIGLDRAYATQHALIARRLGRGERPVGVKLGFTSRAKAVQMGVDDVIIGTLTDAMRIEDGGSFDPSRAIHARVEPELAFLLGAELDASADGDPMAAVAGAAPALELIDSRFRDFRFSLDDVVADNASAAGFVTGPWTSPEALGTGLDNRAVALEFDGRQVAIGSTGAILGDPRRALVAAARLAAAHGFALRAGTVLLAGAATAAVPVPARGLVEASVTGLGRVSVRIGTTTLAAKEGTA